MPVYVITGKLGSGKGLIAVSKIQEYLNQGRRVATNIDLKMEKLINPWAKKSIVYRLPDFPTSSDFNAIGKGYDGDLVGDHRNGGLFLDEAALWFNARTFNERDRAEKIALITSFLSWGLSQLDSLITSVPVLASVGYLLPDNTALCVSAIVSTDVMCGVYSLGSRVLFKKTDIATP